ncbi:MAG: hypothetical protein ACRC1Z_22250, partial [Waterburya sp.]
MANIGLRHAIQRVKEYISGLSDVLGNNVEDFKIEETELSEDEQFWLITVSFNREVDPRKEKIYISDPLAPNSLFSSIQKVADLVPQKQTFIIERNYKVFKVDAKTGKVLSMKMYKS